MTILGIVPARGGSRRLPGKNIRTLGGRPLIAWTIDAARQVPVICDVLVSTNDPEIAAVATACGAQVPWLRPPELSTDTSGVADAAIHALDWYEQERGSVDGVILLQPTSPFRSAASIEAGIDRFERSGRRPVIGLSPVKAHPRWCYYLEGGTVKPFLDDGGIHQRSQDLEPAYVVNGAIYVIAPADLRRLRSFYSDDMVPLVMEHPADAIDIDTEWDWRMTEAMLGILHPGLGPR